MTGDLEVAAHAHEPAAEVVLDPPDGAFDVGALVVAPILGIAEVKVIAPLALFCPFGFGLFAARVAVDQRDPAGPAAVLRDGFGIVGGIHKFVEEGNAFAGQTRQRGRDLAVVDPRNSASG